MNDSFVYIWTDLLTSKQYIGYHKGTPDDGYVCSSKPMLTEYNMRPQDFTREIVAHGTQPDMLTFEQDFIKSTNAHNDPGYYNQALSVGPFYCTSHTQETRARMSTTHKGRYAAMSPESRAQMSVVRKESYNSMSPESRARMRDSQKGTTRSPERRAEIGAVHRGKILSPETKALIGAASRGRNPSPETRAKMSMVRKGKVFTPEHKANLSAAHKKRYQQAKESLS